MWKSPGGGDCWPDEQEFTWDGRITTSRHIQCAARADMQRGMKMDDFENTRWVRMVNQMQAYDTVEALRHPGAMQGDISQKTWIKALGNYMESWVGFSHAVVHQNANMPTNSTIYLRPVSKYRELMMLCDSIWYLFMSVGCKVSRRYTEPKTIVPHPSERITICKTRTVSSRKRTCTPWWVLAPL